MKVYKWKFNYGYSLLPQRREIKPIGKYTIKRVTKYTDLRKYTSI